MENAARLATCERDAIEDIGGRQKPGRDARPRLAKNKSSVVRGCAASICSFFLTAVFPLQLALAADMPVRPLQPAPAPPFTWTGVYIGGNTGGTWAQPALTDSFFGLTFPTGASKGALVSGGQIGFNVQSGFFIWGVEAEFEGIANNKTSPGVLVPVVPPSVIQVTSTNRWIATLAARFGGVPVSNFLIFGKAGGGWVRNDGFTITDLNIGTSLTNPGSNTRAGWLLGMGIEWAAANNWTVRFDWDYLHLNNRTFTIPAGAPFPPALIGDTFTGNNNVQTLTIGFNYLFNWAPVPARY
jgi:outer membrane immunogenic protein